MSQTSLARIGLRLGTLGSALSLAYAAPIAEGDVSNDAHSYASRTGWYHPTATSMGFVTNGGERLRLWSDGGVQIGGGYAASPGVGALEVAGAGVFGGAVTVPDGAAAAPGLRVTSEASGLYRYSSTELGFAVAGSYAMRLTSSGLLVVSVSANTTSDALYVTRSLSVGAASQIYNATNAALTDTSAVAGVTYYSSVYRGILNITGNGDNAGYDRGFTFEAFHRGNGTRNSVQGAFIQVGTYNGGGDSTGTITNLRGIEISAVKTTSSVVTESTLCYLGANVGTTKYAIWSAPTSGVVSIGDVSSSLTATANSIYTAGGIGCAGVMVAGGKIVAPAGFDNNSAVLAAGTYNLNLIGAAGAARDLIRAGISAFSNGFTVQYDGSVMVYTMADGALTVGGVLQASSIVAGGLSVTGAVDNPAALSQFIAQWGGGATATENSAVYANPSILALTGNKTGTVGLASIRTGIDTNSALTSAVTVTGMAGWYEKSSLIYALGVGGALAVTNYYGGYVANMPALVAGVTITNQYGIYLEAPTRGGTINASLRALGLVWFDAAENHAITRVSGDTNLDATHFTIEVDASGGAVNINLPDSTGAGVNGRIYNVVKVDATANAVNINRAGADTINGATTVALTVQYQARTVQARAATPGYSII